MFCLFLAGVSAEYVWTETEWKWKEPGAGQKSPNITSNGDNFEDSGKWSDFEDDYYDDQYDEYDGYNYIQGSGEMSDFEDRHYDEEAPTQPICPTKGNCSKTD